MRISAAQAGLEVAMWPRAGLELSVLEASRELFLEPLLPELGLLECATTQSFKKQALGLGVRPSCSHIKYLTDIANSPASCSLY